MSIKLILENTTPLSSIESWEYTLAVVNERPFVFGEPYIDSITGIYYYDELHSLNISRESISTKCN